MNYGVSRALRFMDSFIKILRLRGHNIDLDSQGTYAVVDQERIKVVFRESARGFRSKSIIGITLNYMLRAFYLSKRRAIIMVNGSTVTKRLKNRFQP